MAQSSSGLTDAAGTVDVIWPLLAAPPSCLPVDHGYALFGALSRIVPSLHENRPVGVHPIRGAPTGHREMQILPSSSRLVIRLPASLMPTVLPLSGANLQVGGCNLTTGVPSVRSLTPSPVLISRLVTVKNATTAESHLSAARDLISRLGVTGEASIPARRTDSAHPLELGRDAMVRRTVRIAGKEVVGYALAVTDLSPEDSIRLQAAGIGGRRHFGCGVFVPGRVPS